MEAQGNRRLRLVAVVTGVIALGSGMMAAPAGAQTGTPLDAILSLILGPSEPEEPPTPPAATCRGVKATIVGTAGNDRITGTAAQDIIAAGAGNDVISGLQGDDIICGEDGNDQISANLGSDTVEGGAGDDLISTENDQNVRDYVSCGDGGNDGWRRSPNDVPLDNSCETVYRYAA